jgi:hypothetical protein
MENDSAAPPHLTMSQWVIYDHPRDYPDQFVLRRWDIIGSNIVPTDEVALAKTLPEIRTKVPGGLYCLERFADDDACIVEVWL